ncbi:uncharacterized protein VP01_1268g10 [Puccinia sorghi]|uniref:Uncharacterized protein n=1 Tax=Puccinia sorghi TaxID=27349 RepID=A0A0L6VP14_9BASI|nr:uncharacterized protein VP01_1268g10 [Puccinia sorghi]
MQPTKSNGINQTHLRKNSGTSSPVKAHFDQLEQFQWNDQFQEALTSLARTGLPPPLSSLTWPSLLQAMLFSLKRTVENYLKLGEASLFDTREEPAGGWLWTSEDLQKNIDRISLALNDFSDQTTQTAEKGQESLSPPTQSIRAIQSAPFTIQRLAELMFHDSTVSSSNSTGIHPHYTTLPKFLRAIQRVLSVSSPVKSFSVNTFILPQPNQFTSLADPSTSASSSVYGDGISSIIHTPRSRRHSTSTPITPILSTVPWLINSANRQSLSPELTSSEGRRSRHTSPLLLSSESGERPITPPLTSPSSPSAPITTPPPHNTLAATLLSPTPNHHHTSPLSNLLQETIASPPLHVDPAPFVITPPPSASQKPNNSGSLKTASEEPPSQSNPAKSNQAEDVKMEGC